jgi:hypothetical protein
VLCSADREYTGVHYEGIHEKYKKSSFILLLFMFVVI